MSSSQTQPKSPYLTKLGWYVSRRADNLQRRYLTGDPSGRAALAQLRNGAGKAAGSDPNSWDLVFRDFPADLVGDRDEPNRAETAVHAALSLFAIHMQSAKFDQHVPGIGLGTAIRRLVGIGDTDTQTSPVVRRFHMLGTAATLEETLHHARGLVQQLRASNIGLDYGRLAEDLYNLQFPERSDGVRLRWARDLFRSLATSEQDDSANNITDPNKDKE